MPETLAGFNISEFLTPKGIKHNHLLQEIGGCNSADDQLTIQAGLAVPNWQHTPAMQLFQNLTGNGGRPIAGPMLVLQGTTDSAVPVQVTTQQVNDTCAKFPDSQLEYATFEGADHVPMLYAAQQVWLDWIADRFAGREPAKPCTKTQYSPARGVQSYQKELELYLEIATQAYEVA